VTALWAVALGGLPEVRKGDDLAGLLADAAGGSLADGNVLCVAHKVVSKVEGRLRRLGDVQPGERASELAARLGRDPRHVQVVLDEAAEVVRDERVLVCRTRHGFVCANAGVDASNAGEPDAVVLLPEDPDASARTLRAGLRERAGVAPAVLVTDSFGRAWRHGQSEVAIGCAGLAPLDDWRGRGDRDGRELAATWIAVADEAAAAADLARSGKDSGEPAVVVRGLERFVTPEDGPGAAALIRPLEEDLFR
jgi:coenzyme F420-0:L-glutamate ligase/coenzyme F420-1:gamma-L-glutamate ligase